MQTSTINLPTPLTDSSYSLEKALTRRRTRRDYNGMPLSLDAVSQLLWAGQGACESGPCRNAPSAGGVYPAELLLVANDVTGIDAGIYRYQFGSHSLEPGSSAGHRSGLEETAIGPQPWISDASAVIVVCMNMSAIIHHFRDQAPKKRRGERYAYVETGAISQNIHLQATAMDIGMVHVGGFVDEKLAAALDLPENLVPTAMLCLGQ
jgi:SagB-type dehydrogenase family enzyme